MMSCQGPLTRVSYALVATLALISSNNIVNQIHISASPSVPIDDNNNDNNKRKRIAIIGGGIGGTFAAKYLTDYDAQCQIHSISIFSPPNQPSSNDGDNDNNANVGANIQTSRVSSYTTDDGTVVELGASVIYSGNRLATEMMTAKSIDGEDVATHDLQKAAPFSPGKRKEAGMKGTFHKGMGIYVGTDDADAASSHPSTPWALLTTSMTKEETRSAMVWRYNLDLYRVNVATETALEGFERIYDLLQSRHPDSFFESPDRLWDAVGLGHVAHTSLEDYMDEIGVDGYGVGGLAWWRRVLDWKVEQGSFRSEMFEAINLCNNNKNNTQMTALAGLVNFVASKGTLFAIDGGNDQLMPHAIRQATSQRRQACKGRATTGDNEADPDTNTITQIQKQVKTVVSKPNGEGMELFSDKGKRIGTYDIVILAAPLQFCGISFLVQGSLFDSDLLSTMPLNGLVDGDTSNANEHGHRSAIGDGHLPTSATRRYTQVVTTVVRHATLSASYFDLDTDNDGANQPPRAIIFTERGRERSGLTSLSQITPNPGVYKVFSPVRLTAGQVEAAFGPAAEVEHVEMWGGERGGATPDFNGAVGTSVTSARFLLYDAEHGIGGGGAGEGEGMGKDGGRGNGIAPALYYVNAMEAAVSAIEISAIGAGAVAKLVAKRLGLVEPEIGGQGDEL